MLTAEQIIEALDTTVSEWKPANEIYIEYGQFPAYQNAEGKWLMSPYGRKRRDTLLQWEASRKTAAQCAWLGDEKESLPCEVGAILATESGRVRRRGQDVNAFTWIFIDSDAGQPATLLRERLQHLQICFLLTESARSRIGNGGVKWHLFLPLAQPKSMPSLSLPNVDAAATLDACRDWWRAVHRHVAHCLLLIGGFDSSETDAPENLPDDPTAATLARPAFIPHRPAGGPPRFLIANEGRLLQLDGFLRATGFTRPIDAPVVMIEKTPRRRSAGVVNTGAEAITADTQDTDPVSAPTQNETTGTLLARAFEYFNRVGPQIDKYKWRVICPWHYNHTQTPQHDPAGFAPNDSSVVFWTHDAAGKPGGGFKCQHNGGGVRGQCSDATAADVLRWARLKGCPLPDRDAIGAVAAQSNEAVTTQSDGVVNAPTDTATVTAANTPIDIPQPQPLTPTTPLPPAFPGAPAQGAPVSPPPRQATAQQPQKVEIEITTDLLRMRSLAINALGNHPAFYKVGGVLFDLVEESGEDRNGNPRRPWLRKTVAPHLTAELCGVSQWYTVRFGRKGPEQTETTPDRQTVATVLAAGAYPAIRELNGIITTPVFRRDPDFSLVQTPGYDHSLGVLYRPVGNIPRVSTNPSRTQLAEAKKRLLWLIKDFPFRVGEREQCWSVWLAAIFTRFLRFTFTGNIPMFLVSAGAAGSGKGKLIDAAAIISDGAEAWKRTKAGDDAELERAIGAAIREEVPVAVLDNIPRGVILESATLENYLTTPIFTTREIGTSKNIKGVKGGWNDTLWWANGNGLQTGGDMSRRVLRIDIEDKTGRPESRRPEVSNLERYCHANRAELLSHALTLLSGFFAARKNGFSITLPPFASFEGWSLVREAVVWCGLPDPYLARGKADDDIDTANFIYLVDHLRRMIGVGVEQGVGHIAETLIRDKTTAAPKWRDFFDFLVSCDVKLGRVEGAASSLGRLFQKYDKRVVPVGRWQLLHYRTPRGSKVKILDCGGEAG